MDYAYWKDFVYAKHFLEKRQFRLYYGLYETLQQMWVKPSVLVLLACSTTVAMQRLRARKRKGEEHLTREDIDAIRKLTERMANLETCPVIAVNTDDLAIHQQSAARNALLQRVTHALHSL